MNRSPEPTAKMRDDRGSRRGAGLPVRQGSERACDVADPEPVEWEPVEPVEWLRPFSDVQRAQ